MPLSDLRISETATPELIFIDENFEVSWTVINQGEEVTLADNWFDGVFLSTDETFDEEEDFYLTGDSYEESLAVDESYTESRFIDIEDEGYIFNDIDLNQDWYLLFVADAGNDEDENNENNNVVAVPIEFDVPDVDLVVSETTAPTSANLGETIDISWIVTNQGEEETSSSFWYDGVYLYNFENDEYIYLTNVYNDRFEQSLASGESYTQATSVTLPQQLDLEQDWYVVVVTDISRNQPEIDGNNNNFTSFIDLTVPEPPPIVGTISAENGVITSELSEEDSNNPTRNGSFSDDYTLTDVTAGELVTLNLNSPDFDTYLQLINADTQELISVDDDSGVGLNSQLTFISQEDTNYIVRVTSYTNATGNYTLSSSETAIPDLVVTDATVPNAVILGETIEVTWDVTNQGNGTASANWFDSIYISSNATFDSTDTFVTSFSAAQEIPLESGESYSITQNITIPTNFIEAGDEHYLLFITDGGNNQRESDETNNIRAVSIDINAPNLVVSETTAPSEAIVGETVEVSWTVENNGDVEAPADWYDTIFLSNDEILDDSDIRAYSEWAGNRTPLAAGENYSVTRNITLPSNAQAGSQFLIFATDKFYSYSNNQGETDETDNTRVVPIELSAPNLVVTDYNAPNFASIGQTLDVSWTVENQGDVTAFGNWYDYIYLSEDATFDNSDTYLTDRWAGSSTPLAAGESYTATRSINLPINQQGERYLLFVADGFNRQGETDETDNSLAVPITIDDNGPNLEVTAVTAPDDALLGETVEVSWTVTNSGGVTASANWYDYIYISDDETFDANDTFVSSRWAASNTPLADGESYTATQNITIPDTQTGNRYLLFVTDAGFNRQGETDETDNVYAHSIEFDALDVDLVVSDISAPVEALSGQEIDVSWTITNQGSEDVTGTWNDYLYLSDDAQVGGDQFYGSFSFTGTIAAGESIIRQQTITLANDLEGDKYFVVQTDANNQIVEFGKENNNTTVDNEAVSVILSPFPNLQVENVTAPETAFSSQETVIEWTVTNTGNGATSASIWYDRVWLSLDQTFDNTDLYLGQAANPSYLDVGESYTNNLTATLPQGIDGNYYFLVQTDYFNQVFELENENDNFGVSEPTDIDLTPPPDLQVSSVNPPSQAFSGQPMSLSWTVTNEGTGRTLETLWYDEIYMSADEVIDGNDFRLGIYFHRGTLDVGESYTATRNVNLPIGIDGDFFFLVRTDTFNNVYEQAFEDNNDSSSNQTKVNLTPPPDLEVEFVEAPTQATASRNLSIDYRVTNFGATETPNYRWQDAFYLSTDDQLDIGSDLLLGERYHYGRLNPGDSYENTVNFTLPDGINGEYYIFTVTDSRNEVFELDNANNQNFNPQKITIASLPADLVVSSATAPTIGEAGKAIQIDWTVSNQGTGDTAVTNWVDRIIASTDDIVGDLDDVVLGTFTYNGLLDEGESYSRSELVTLPFNLSGDYNLFVVTDADNDVYEATNEDNNNSNSLPIDIVRLTPDLQVTQINAAQTANSGENFTVSWTVENLGIGQTNVDYWYDEVFVSTDTNLGGSNDISLGRVYHSGKLQPGTQYQATHTFELPIDLEGDFHIIVKTDKDNQVIEGTLENNNTAATSITTNVSLSPTPDLVLANVDAPTQAISGQSFDLSWTVRNDGADTSASWRDVFYLSRDQVFDRDSDTYLGFTTHIGGLASGESYTQTQSFAIPRGLSGPFYVFAVTDSSNSVYERDGELNNTGFDGNSMQLILPPPSDLVVGTISIPENAVPGQNATIEYTVENQGSDIALGRWNDSIYISADDQWDVNDKLFTQIQVSGPINSGESYSRTVTAALPGVVPGDYNVIVRSDIRNAVPESDETNNTGASTEQTAVDAELLELGNTDNGTLKQGQAVYYKIEAEAGETLKIRLDSADDDAFNELYLRYGEMPTRGQFDFTTEAPFASDPEIILPTSEAGTYYVLAYGDRVSGEAEYSISAEVLPFSLESIGVDKAGNSGFVTLEIKGARFTKDTAFELVDNDGNVISSERLLLQDSTTAYVTFNLEEQSLGAYDVKATREDGETALLDDALTVENGSGADVATNIDGPDIVRPERNYLFNVNFGNNGDTDLSAPLLLLQSKTSTPMGLELDELSNNGVLQLLGTSDGQLDTLRPGEVDNIPVYYNSSTDPINFNVQAITSESTEAADWDLISESVRPLDVPEAEWDAFWGRIQPRIGETWGDYVNLLNELARDYSQPGEEIRDVRELFGRLYEDNPEFLPSSALSGQLLDSETGDALNGVEIAAYQIVDGEYIFKGTATTEADGQFDIAYLEAGTYEVALADRSFDMDRDGEADAELPTYTLSQNSDLTNLDLYAVETPEPHIDESNFAIALDNNSVAHALWSRNGEIWHAQYNGEAWVEAAAIGAGAFGTDLNLQASELGLVATWTHGEGNEAEVYYALGQASETGFVWSDANTLTQDTVYDSKATSLITNSGELLVVSQKSDYDIYDDTDLYYQVEEIDSFISETAFNLAATLEPAATSNKFSYSWVIDKSASIPRIIPIIGGRSDLKVSGKLEGEVDCDLSISGGLEGSLSLFNNRATGSVNGSGQAKWKSNKEATRYVFNEASLSLGGAISADIPGWTYIVPGDGFFVDEIFKAEIGISVKGGLTGTAKWNSGASFPSWPTSGDISAEVSLGPYGTVSVIDGLAQGKVSGIGSMKLELLPTTKLAELALTLGLEAQVGSRTWSYERKWGKSFGSNSTLSTQSDALFFSDTDFVLPDGLSITYNPIAGTNAVYGENSVLADVSQDVYEDAAPDIAMSAEGEILLAWSKSLDLSEGLEGSVIVVSEFDGSTWTQPLELPETIGYTGQVSLLFDGNNNPVVAWTAADSSSVNSETSAEDFYQTVTNGDVFYAVRQNGTWSSPFTEFAMSGNDTSATLHSLADGNLGITWINHDISNGKSLIGAFWDGNDWTTPQTIAVGDIIGDVSLIQTNEKITAYWTADVNPSLDITETSILYSTYDTTWSASDIFEPSLTELSTILLNSEIMTSSETHHNMDSSAMFAPQGISLPTPPEHCKCEEGDPECDDDDDDEDDYEPPVRRPSDPNDILGPDGFGEENWIKATEPFDYTIRFENEPTATAPAQEVIITQQLDEDLDWRTFRVDDFGWGDLYFDLPGDRPFNSQRIDLTTDYGFYVDVFTSIDVTTGLATWRILTVDPETGEAPLDALSGFLPVNNEDGIGEGFVSYSVKAKRTAETGDVIDAEARIVFDTEEPIDTPPIFNTLDTQLPTASVSELPELIEDENGEFLVQWSGSDDENGSGIAGFTVYVSDNGGEFTPWLENTNLTEATYTGELGHTYDFYVVATDNVGNTQEIPTTAQASTQITGGVATIGDFVWLDTNGNGIQDNGENGVGEVTVNLYNSTETLIDTTATDFFGFYSFTDINPGEYFVEFINPDGYVFSPQDQGNNDSLDSDANPSSGRTIVTNLEGGQTYFNWDAGLYQYGSISGQTWNDENGNAIQDTGETGLEGWTIYLDDNNNGQLDTGETSTLTDANGNYSFTELTPGNYTVAEVLQSGWEQTYPGVRVSTTASEEKIYTPSEPEFTSTSLTTPADELINLNNFRSDTRFTDITGSGFATVIIDTGIDLNHPLFGADNDSNGIADRIVYQYDFADNDSDASDINGHGSHVSSIVSGIASQTDIIALKVFKDNGSGYFSDLEESLQWVIDNAEFYNVASVNLSLGDEQNWSTATSRYGIGDELAALASMGIIITSAAGNNFEKFSSQQGLAYPAIDPNTIAVGAVWATNDQIAEFSQRDENFTDIFAPGIPITGADASGGNTTMGGTSQAAPHITGIATLAQQIAVENLGRKLTVSEFRYLLQTTGVIINDGDDENDSVTNTGLDFPRVDMQALAEAILTFNGEISNPANVNPNTNSDDTPLYLPNGSRGTHTITVDSGEIVTDIDFGNQRLNNPPIAVNDTATTNQNEAVTIPTTDLLANDSDVDGDTLSISSVGNATNGTVALNGNNVIFTPDDDFNGAASFEYTVFDGDLTDSATVAVTVNPPLSREIPGTPGRDTLIGDSANNIITGFQGRDILTGGGGNNQFVYTSLRDAGDIITDFEIGSDKIVLTELLDSIGYAGSDAIGDGYVSFGSSRGDAFVQIDQDGAGNDFISRPLVLLQGVTEENLSNNNNFVF